MKTRILEPKKENIRLAAQAVRNGEIVGMPTETVYGLAGSAFNETALTRIFSAKERPTFDPLIVHISKAEDDVLGFLEASNLINRPALSPLAEKRISKLATAFWPGPLTLVMPKNPVVPDLATAGLPTVAVRMPKHPVAQALLEAAGMPLAAPSANRFGRISPTQAKHVKEELEGRVELILDGGPCEVGVESTVISIDPDGALLLLRPGKVSLNEIENLCGKGSITKAQSPTEKLSPQSSPGLLESHYAPRKPMLLLPNSILQLTEDQWEVLRQTELPALLAVLAFSGTPENLAKTIEKQLNRSVTVSVLSKGVSVDLPEAARSLFSEMRKLDHSEAELILAEPCPSPLGLGHAIADRLHRASGGKKI